MSSNSIYPYVYKIVDKQTGEFYIGSRYANVRLNRTAEDDFLKHYFTSGKLKNKIKENPERFDGYIIFQFGEHDVVYWYEQIMIKESIKDSRCANRHFMDPDTKSVVFSTGGKTHSAEARKNMSESQIGKTISEESRKKMSDSKKGRKRSEETVKKMIEGLKGRSPSEEHRNKISDALKGTTQKAITCPHCGVSGGASVMNRWHLDRCKSKV